VVPGLHRVGGGGRQWRRLRQGRASLPVAGGAFCGWGWPLLQGLAPLPEPTLGPQPSRVNTFGRIALDTLP
jgi:hypothetical protein